MRDISIEELARVYGGKANRRPGFDFPSLEEACAEYAYRAGVRAASRGRASRGRASRSANRGLAACNAGIHDGLTFED